MLPYDDEESKDIIIDDRRKDIYQNVSFCQMGCSYQGIDFDYELANCFCEPNLIQDVLLNTTNNGKIKQNELINFKTLSRIFKSNLFVSNFGVIYCYNLVFDLNILKRNIGFYFFFVMLLIQIILFCFFIYKKLKPIKDYMTTFKIFKGIEQKKDKFKSKIKNNIGKSIQKKELNKNGNNLILSNNRITNKVEKMKIRNKNGYINYKNDSIKQLNNNNEFLMTQNVKEESYNKKSINIKNESFKKENKTDNSDIKNQKISNKKFMLEKKRKKHTLKFNKLKNGKNKCCSIIISKKEDDLNDMYYEDIINNDNRTYIRMYWAYFVYSKINSGTFCTENNLNLFIIKLSFFLFTFEISLFFNAFFYSDEYISDAYYNNGILDFVSGLPKSIYSTIISYIIS